MKGIKLRAIVGLFFLVLCAAGVLVAHVWKQNAYVRYSMATVKLGKERAALRNEIALLEVSVGGLRKRARIEQVARERFGLAYGNVSVAVYREPGSGKRAGRDGGDRNGAIAAGKVAWRTSGL